MKNIICKLFGHKLIGPYPIGNPGEVRYLCRRCGIVLVIFRSGKSHIPDTIKEIPSEEILQ